MTDLFEELRAYHESGVALDGEFERAASDAAKAEAIKRAQMWEAELQALVEQLGPATAALFKNVTPIREGEQIRGFLPGASGIVHDPLTPRGSGLSISSTHTKLPMPGGDWVMAWQCHRTRLSRLADLLRRLGPTRPKVTVPDAVKAYLKDHPYTGKRGEKQRLYVAVAEQCDRDVTTVGKLVRQLKLLD